MSDIVETAVREPLDQITDSWSPDAPRGGRAVMNRMIKEKSGVSATREVPQGLKPAFFLTSGGTTEVVPFPVSCRLAKSALVGHPRTPWGERIGWSGPSWFLLS
jgi:hypothetical protein